MRAAFFAYRGRVMIGTATIALWGGSRALQKRYWLAAAVVLTVPNAAVAQITGQIIVPRGASIEVDPDAVSVADRPRYDYAPVGGRLGSFFLYPTITTSVVATDNVRASEVDKRSDVFALMEAQARLSSIWSIHALNVELFADQSVHARLGTEDASQYGGQVDGRLDLARDGNITLKVRAEHLLEERSSFTSPTGARRRVPYDTARVALGGTQTFSRFTMASELSYQTVSYDDTVAGDGSALSQRFRDARIFGADASIAYQISPGYSLLLRGIADRRDYPLDALSPLQPGNLDRTSSGGRIEAGVKLSLASLLYGQLRVGYLVRNYADPRFQDSSGASFGGDLLWNPTRLTSVRLTADRRIDEANSLDAAGVRITEVGTTVDHELQRNLILTGNVRYVDFTPLGPVGDSTEWGGRVSARYLANRRISLRGTYLYTDRTSADPGRAFKENRATITAQLTF